MKQAEHRHRNLQYASSPRDALQCHVDAVKTHRSLERVVGQVQAWPYRNALEYRELVDVLTDLPVMFWSYETASVVEQASRNYPLQREMFVPRMLRAFCVFQKPVLTADIEGHEARLSALSWSTNSYVNHGGNIGLDITGYSWNGSICAPIWWGTIAAWVPDDLSDLNSDPQFRAEKATFLKWVLTASMFVEQDIIVSSPERIGGQVAKRAARDGVTIQDVNVVALRRTVRDHHDTEGDGRHWQTRWVVRGHWRNQWYPKAERHVPVFIHPYIKGPDDKPLKPPKETVFAVTR